MRAFRPTPYQSTKIGPHNREEKAKKAPSKRLRGFLPLLALMAMLGLHRAADTSPLSWSFQGQASALAASNAAGAMMHRADWIGDIVDAIDEILDILEGEGEGEGEGGEGGEGGGDGGGDGGGGESGGD